MIRGQVVRMNMTAPATQVLLGLTLLLVLANGLSVTAFAVDKRRAARGEWRIPELFLLKLALLGGWPGAKLGQWLFRHKTRKQPFCRHLNLIGAFQVVCIAAGFGMAHVPAVDFAQVKEMAMAAITPAPDEPGAEQAEASPLPRRFGPGSDGKPAINRLTP